MGYSDTVLNREGIYFWQCRCCWKSCACQCRAPHINNYVRMGHRVVLSRMYDSAFESCFCTSSSQPIIEMNDNDLVESRSYPSFHHYAVGFMCLPLLCSKIHASYCYSKSTLRSTHPTVKTQMIMLNRKGHRWLCLHAACLYISCWPK